MKKRSPNPSASAPLVRKPKLLLVGEGPQDIGRPNDPGGALAGFLQGVLTGPGEPVDHEDLPFVMPRVMRWTTLLIQRPSKKPRTLDKVLTLLPDGERARAALLLAAVEGYDCVAIMRDCERADNIGLGPILRQAHEAYSAAIPEEEGTPALVVAAPCRCHETWLLADRESVHAILDNAAHYHFSADPEDRPACDELKDHLNKHADRLHQSLAELRRRLAFGARPAELSRRCKRCYPAFKKDVDNELRPLCQPPGGASKRKLG